MKKVNLKTSDKIKIAGNYYAADNPKGYLVLIHMMPANKESWNGFALAAQQNSYASLAIDLRGHGESDGGPDGFRDFSDEDHQKSIMDARAAVDFQIAEGHSKIFLAGASIGANLALKYLAESEKISAAVLLSAGFNYRGIETLPLAAKVRPSQGVFFVASRDDARSGVGADKMAEELYAKSGGMKKIKIFETGGHGTDLFNSHPDLMDDIINWLKKF